jgi:hypothetical protein
MVKLAAASQGAHAPDPSVFLSRMNGVLCGNTQNQFDNAAGHFFGRDAHCEALRKTEGTTPSDAADLIVSTVQKWSPTQEHDLTVLVCDYVG